MILHPIQQGGALSKEAGPLPGEMTEILVATAALYTTTGYLPPWICFIATANGVAVGTCGFKSPPVDGRVEIAYFTFPSYEGRGIATQMARNLLTIARETDPTVLVAAQTLPGRNASHRILEKLGFTDMGTREHPEDGTVLEWQKTPHRETG